jgi:hypothetical protein
VQPRATHPQDARVFDSNDGRKEQGIIVIGSIVAEDIELSAFEKRANKELRERLPAELAIPGTFPAVC